MWTKLACSFCAIFVIHVSEKNPSVSASLNNFSAITLNSTINRSDLFSEKIGDFFLKFNQISNSHRYDFVRGRDGRNNISRHKRSFRRKKRCRRYLNPCGCYEYCPYYNCPRCPYQRPYWGSYSIRRTCNCDPEGSLFDSCDSRGQCRCRPHFEGSKCHRCKEGYFKNGIDGCIECDCNKNGSESLICLSDTGQCPCKSGVGDRTCESCLPKYYGDIQKGCQPCDPCDKEGHICHPNTGKCVCPPFTSGPVCELCVENSWGYEPGKGCKNCSCSATGSIKRQCDRKSGQCSCQIGYEGEQCDRCSFGFYGYPTCKQCLCNVRGTLNEEFTDDISRCNEDGSCRCKMNVEGQKCDQCKKGSFGLDKSNDEGCIKCFCFGRTTQCQASDYTWDQIRTEKIEQTKESCISSSCSILPKKFTGDLTLSYGGLLRITSSSAQTYFTVQIIGNNLVLESTFSEEVKIDEKNWRVLRTSSKLLPECNNLMTRDCFMVVLQNVTSVLVNFDYNNDIGEIILDKAVNLPTTLQTVTVEHCDCPKEYTSLSCQNPSSGFYRQFEDFPENVTWIDRIVGVAKKCECNGKSDSCDTQTGYCQNCKDYTSGRHCEICADGYYKNDQLCLPCWCPSEEQNFAKHCSLGNRHNQFICECKQGYTGKTCNKCDNGYFGKPHEPFGFCEACNCNPYGSGSSNCDKYVGQCKCNPGFTGKQCSECVSSRTYIKDGICTPCDECTQNLFNLIDAMSGDLDAFSTNFNGAILAPWRYLNSTHQRYLHLNEKFKKVNNLINSADNLTRATDKTNNIYSKINEILKEFSRTIKDTEALQLGSKQVQKNLIQFHKRLETFLNTLNNFGTSHLDVRQALENAKIILREIESISKRMATLEVHRPLSENCDKILDEVKIMFPYDDMNVSNISNSISILKVQTSDLENITNFVRKTNKYVKIKNKQNWLDFKDIESKINGLNVNKDDLIATFKDARDKLRNSNSLLAKINGLRDRLSKNNLTTYKDLLDEKDRDFNDKTRDLDQCILNIKNHNKYLNATLKNLYSQLNFTQDEWKKINAGESYENIINGIAEARATVKEVQKILDNAFTILAPADRDSILTQATISRATSDRLKQRIINLSQKDLRKVFDNLKYQYSNAATDLYKIGRSNNKFNSLLLDLNKQIQTNKPDLLRATIEKATQIFSNMTKIISEIKGTLYVNEHSLNRPFEKYRNLTSKSNIDALNKNIHKNILTVQSIRQDSTLSNILIDQSNDVSNNLKNLEKIKSRILALKANLTYTADLVTNLYLPLSLNNCSRWYRVGKTGVFNSIAIRFNCSSCNIFNMTSGGRNIQLKIDNGMLNLFWNGQVRSVAVPVNRMVSVQLERRQNMIYLSTDTNRYKYKNDPVIIEDNQLFEISENDLINVGGSIADEITSGCIFEMLFNNMNIGLWKFVYSIGKCEACDREQNSYKFRVPNTYIEGGYRIYNASLLDPRQFSVSLNFRTFDENCLLLMIQEIKNPCAFLALSLKDGRLLFSMRHKDNVTSVELPQNFNKKFNNGRKTNVNIELQYTRGKQFYVLKINNHNYTQNKNLSPYNVFRIKQTKYFVGGVSPDFDSSCYNDINTTSFIGFLDHKNDKSLSSIASHNTYYRDKEQINFKNAWFIGKGHLNINSTIKFKKKSFSLYFEINSRLQRTFLMTIDKLGKIFVDNDKLVFQLLSNNKLVAELKSNTPLENMLNTVKILVTEDESVLSVDDNEGRGNGIKLPKGDFILLNIGQDEDKIHRDFLGGISNIYVENKNVDFNTSTIKSFEYVEIGRWRAPLQEPKSLTVTSANENMQNTQSCLSTNYRTDPGAIKFGDKMPSYILRKNPFWKKNYTIELQFRTMSPNGLLFIATGSQSNAHYNILHISKGYLELVIKGRKKPAKVKCEHKVDDGQWHSLSIHYKVVKKRRKLQITLDGQLNKPVRVPKSNVRNEIYIGNLLYNFTDNKDVIIHQFRGCIKGFKINEINQLNTKSLGDIKNLGSCFPKIEEGAYFGGDAYAIFKKDFEINHQLELGFEFKTSEHNGVFLSVSNSGNSPAFSIELQNGAVVMSIDVGNGAISNVTNNLDSDFSLCNNRWHNVTALYSDYELTVIVDGIRKSWVQSGSNSLMDEIEAPLFIGGLSDSAPGGTVKIRENFKGCIKNLKIGNLLLHWIEMDDLNKVLLDSCPVT